MFLFFLVVFVLVPIAELWVIIQVGSVIGVWETIGLLILDSVVGAWLVRREGLGVLARVQGQLGRGEIPTASLVDGALILFAGALMLTPGFITDGVGLLLLIPPTRAGVRRILLAMFQRRIRAGEGAFGSARWVVSSWTTRSTDVRGTDITDIGTVDYRRGSEESGPPELDSN